MPVAPVSISSIGTAGGGSDCAAELPAPKMAAVGDFGSAASETLPNLPVSAAASPRIRSVMSLGVG